jgi:hypothetical protein
MNIKLFTDDNTRENVLKHVRGGNTLCYEPPLQSVKVIRGNTFPSSSLSRGNTTAGVRIAQLLSTNSSHLFFKTPIHFRSLTPSPTTYTSECYAQDLIDDLNKNQEGK